MQSLKHLALERQNPQLFPSPPSSPIFTKCTQDKADRHIRNLRCHTPSAINNRHIYQSSNYILDSSRVEKILSRALFLPLFYVHTYISLTRTEEGRIELLLGFVLKACSGMQHENRRRGSSEQEHRFKQRGIVREIKKESRKQYLGK